jgi:hypothetical protein
MFDHHHLTDRELVLALDRELSSWRRAEVDAHLLSCAACQERREQLRVASHEFASTCCAETAEAVADDDARAHEASRDRLRRELMAAAPGGAESRASAGWGLDARLLRWGRWGVTAAALVTTAWLIQATAPARLIDRAGRSATAPAVDAGMLPVASLTPGVTWNVSASEICDAGVREQREIPLAVREQVVRAYGMQGLAESQYELDYLITPELGGAPDARNLWPQRYASRVWNAHVKDQLERLLPRLVCDGQLPLEVAQRDLARDWIAAYKKYFRTTAPLQTEASFRPDDDALMYPVWRAASGPQLQLVALR